MLQSQPSFLPTEDIDIVVRKDTTTNLNVDMTDEHEYVDMTDPEEFTDSGLAEC